MSSIAARQRAIVFAERRVCMEALMLTVSHCGREAGKSVTQAWRNRNSEWPKRTLVALQHEV